MTEKMNTIVDQLIVKLSAEASPVKRLRAPSICAFEWLVVIGTVALGAIAVFSDPVLFISRIRDPRLAVELMATLVTGIFGVIATFQLGMPDRTRAWMSLPLPPFVVWLATTGYQCWDQRSYPEPSGLEVGSPATCLQFILLASIPFGAALLIAMRRAVPLDRNSVAITGGLGIAGLSMFTLQFFHPLDVTVMDLAVHVVSVGLVIGGAVAMERFLARRPSLLWARRRL